VLEEEEEQVQDDVSRTTVKRNAGVEASLRGRGGRGEGRGGRVSQVLIKGLVFMHTASTFLRRYQKIKDKDGYIERERERERETGQYIRRI
jgi:hypothetical protein